MKILFIGNSFSEDANYYLYRLAQSVGADFEALNLIIGGCSFERHAECVEGNLRDYLIQYNGIDYHEEENHATIEDGLKYRDWDFISIQQVSGSSGRYETYHPYIDTLLAKIKELCPKAKILMHKTWAYEHGANHSEFHHYGNDPKIMHVRICETYDRVSREIGAYGVCPSGDVIEALRSMPEFNINEGGISLHRDGFHLSMSYGRFAAACTWFEFLGIGDLDKSTLMPEGEDIDPSLVALIKKTVKETVK